MLSLDAAVQTLTQAFNRIPGSPVITRYIGSSYQDDPARSVLELCLLLFALRYFFASHYSVSKKEQNYVSLTEAEIDDLVDEWTPDPLVPPMSDQDRYLYLDSVPVVKGATGPHVTLASGQSVLNMASTDVYNLTNDPQVKSHAVESIRTYGVGSCGPAGFYGNQDAHVYCEKAMAQFLGVEAAILYSQGLATAASVIPCFLKRGDVIVADRGCNLGIQKGILLSRATIYWYDHNDLADLEACMVRERAAHARRGRRALLPRRFVITESIFETTGDCPDLKAIVALKNKYKYRLLLDESWSLGVQGPTGRGLPEVQGVSRHDEVDISLASLATAFGAAGGICAGRSYMVEHQRITSLAYTFSATMPAYLANTTSLVLDRLNGRDHAFVAKMDTLKARGRQAYARLNACDHLLVISEPEYPIMVLAPAEELADERRQRVRLQAVVDRCRDKGVLVSLERRVPQHELFSVSEHLIRVFLSAEHTEQQVDRACAVIEEAFAGF